VDGEAGWGADLTAGECGRGNATSGTWGFPGRTGQAIVINNNADGMREDAETLTVR